MNVQPRTLHLLRVFAVASVLVAIVHAEPDIAVTPIARDGQVLVTFDMTNAFGPDVRDAIQSGLPTTARSRR